MQKKKKKHLCLWKKILASLFCLFSLSSFCFFVFLCFFLLSFFPAAFFLFFLLLSAKSLPLITHETKISNSFLSQHTQLSLSFFKYVTFFKNLQALTSLLSLRFFCCERVRAGYTKEKTLRWWRRRQTTWWRARSRRFLAAVVLLLMSWRTELWVENSRSRHARGNDCCGRF